ncbi:hypothetical protein ACMDCR_15200 [Labrys okinawensis]
MASENISQQSAMMAVIEPIMARIIMVVVSVRKDQTVAPSTTTAAHF